jgi:hypothetical protein
MILNMRRYQLRKDLADFIRLPYQLFADDPITGVAFNNGNFLAATARPTVMRPPRFLGGLIAMVGFCCFAQACAQKEVAKPEKAHLTEAKPQIAVDQREFNFGKVKQGQPVEHVFTIENRGNAELVIQSAVGSCGCLATVLSSKKIAPGTKGQIKATLSTEGRRGKQTKQITINSNDPSQTQLVLKVEGEVVADIAFDPGFFWLKEVKPGEKATQQFTVSVSDPEKVKVAAITADDKRFVIRRISGEPKGNAVYELQFRGSRKVESISAQLSATAEDQSIAPVRATIRLEVISDLRYPKVIQLVRKPDGTASVDLTITSRSKKPFLLKRAEDSNKLLKLEILEKKGPNATIRAQLTAQSPAPQPGKRASFTVFTSDKNEPKVEIGYFVYPRTAAPSKPASAPPPKSSATVPR